MNPLGETYLDSGKGHLYFNQNDSQFYCYRLEGDDPPLSLLFSALPRIPLSNDKGITWKDTLPLQAVHLSWYWYLFSLLRVMMPSIGEMHYSAHWRETGLIEGCIKHAEEETEISAYLDTIN